MSKLKPPGKRENVEICDHGASQNFRWKGDLDLLQVRLDEKIQSTVAVELEGIEEAPGAKEGGVLEHVTRELNIEALPTDIPERVLVDVSGMEAAAAYTNCSACRTSSMDVAPPSARI